MNNPDLIDKLVHLGLVIILIGTFIFAIINGEDDEHRRQNKMYVHTTRDSYEQVTAL